MGTRSKRQRRKGGLHSRTHGTCEHQWIDGGGCLRCGMTRRGRRPIRERDKRKTRGRDHHKLPKACTPECVPAPLRRSLLEKLKGFFNRKEKKS